MKHALLIGAVLALSHTLAADIGAQSLSTNDDGTPSMGSLSTGAPTAQAPGSLTTLFAGGNGFAGNMFDMVTTSDLVINSIDINCNAAVGSAVSVDVWYMTGTVVGNEMNAAVWTQLGSYTGTSAGFGAPTSIDMTGNGMTWVAGTSYGIYVDLTSYALTGSLAYTNGAGSTGTIYSNADMTLTTWYGNRNTDVMGPFTQGVFQIRDWNGTIHYDGAGPSNPVYSITGLTGGGTATFTATNVTAGGGVLIGYSLTGAGPTMTPFGPVDMSPPISQLPTLTADPAGVATLSTGIPARASGFTLFTQCADLGSGLLSNSLAELIL
ncbi:MAG: hypothetical protein QF489_08005 [Planctomycetota bacterium]|jgi:hypothetical protein|nr:hypothetical protein [Planctomycetota bacterium]